MPFDPGDLVDIELVRQIQGGGPTKSAAFTRLLERYQDRLYAVCLRVVGNPDAAADLAQDSMVKILQGLDSYDGRSKLSTWMIRVTMNTCLSYLRAQRLRKHASLEADLEGRGPAKEAPAAPEADKGSERASDRGSAAAKVAWHATPMGTGGAREQTREPGPEEGVQLEERRRRVSAALTALEPDQRAILVLRNVQGLDYQQIADVLEVAVGTVKSRLFRARMALRELIEADEKQ